MVYSGMYKELAQLALAYEHTKKYESTKKLPKTDSLSKSFVHSYLFVLS